MATRHSQVVINTEGVLKLSQYGQWDGYPSGQGVKVLEFLRSANLEKYDMEVSKLRQPTKEEKLMINKDKDWEFNYPYLSRDCGSNIHKMIENGEVKFVNIQDKKDALSWCDGFYTIDLQKNTFTAEYYNIKQTYSLDNLPSNETFLTDFKEKI